MLLLVTRGWNGVTEIRVSTEPVDLFEETENSPAVPAGIRTRGPFNHEPNGALTTEAIPAPREAAQVHRFYSVSTIPFQAQ